MNSKKIIAYASLLGVLVLGIISYQIYRYALTDNTAFQQDKVHVFIPTNATWGDVKDVIEPLVKDFSSFQKVAEQRGYVGNIKAGKFELKKGQSNIYILQSLQKNIPVKVVFNNQERLEDFAVRIASQIEPDSMALMKAFYDESFLKERGFTKENVFALLIPNTFEFYWNTSAIKFREAMVKEYDRFWNEERRLKAEQIGLTPIEVSVLASIVQKETVKVDEREKVAGVYMNRIKRNHALEADPTVVYAYKLVNNDWEKVIKRVLRVYTKIESPYNTYRQVGLPPGPIFMSDISSIDAVLNYEKHDYMFFCASPDRLGYHEFAVNYSQHQANYQRYKRWLDKNGY